MTKEEFLDNFEGCIKPPHEFLMELEELLISGEREQALTLLQDYCTCGRNKDCSNPTDSTK